MTDTERVAVVTVTDPLGKSWRVVGWAALIIVKLLVGQEEINSLHSGKLTADMGPSGLKVRVEKEIGRVE